MIFVRFGGAALVLLLGLGCGRVGYDPRPALELPDARAADLPSPDLAPADRPAPDGLPADVSDVSVEATVDAPVEAPVDAPVDATLDAPPAAPAAGPPDGTTSCLEQPDPLDLIADFEAGRAVTVRVGARGGPTFELVRSGAGTIAVSPPLPTPLCGSFRFMTLQGTDIPADRNGHIQAQFVGSVAGQPTPMLDAREYRGVRLSLRAAQAMPVTLVLPDRNTTNSPTRPLDHFRIVLNATRDTPLWTGMPPRSMRTTRAVPSLFAALCTGHASMSSRSGCCAWAPLPTLAGTLDAWSVTPRLRSSRRWASGPGERREHLRLIPCRLPHLVEYRP